jgi:translation initiation factor 2B subunit (eIF-2B alpha/beta/delta family)
MSSRVLRGVLCVTRACRQAGIDTTLIADDSVFALMARVNKVIISAHAVC